ncbi:MAG: DUF4256 domain-containing protein [Gemmatimonadaceae bacterium]|nr:DUF4256 domain-containing protein [Gemmatimonadaceae bacterium]MCW5824973.1 DUF4256 domain-containing protein [Gemmatimonadaceae bacterium]
MPKASPNDKLLATLEQRFTKHAARHPGLAWDAVRKRLDANAAALTALRAMEDTGGEPDVTGVDKKSGRITFTDCSPESPAGRRSLCYDRAALDARKEAKPKSSALDVAAKIGIRILSEAEYRALQTLGAFDLKTSSWILTPAPIRKLGGALFCDRRYDQVFTYHNGAQSYYAARGFRGALEV